MSSLLLSQTNKQNRMHILGFLLLLLFFLCCVGKTYGSQGNNSSTSGGQSYVRPFNYSSPSGAESRQRNNSSLSGGESCIWQLNQSFTVNSFTTGYNFDPITMPGLMFFPLNLNVSYPNAQTSDAYAFLCFTSPSSLIRSYTLSICLTTLFFPNLQSLNHSRTLIVWSANRGTPVSGERISLTLDSIGNLLLSGSNGGSGSDDKPYWATNTSNKGVVRMELSQQYPVNLILYGSNNQTIWQSVDYPTDTLTFHQVLTQGMELVSWASPTDPSEGNYTFKLEPSGVMLYSNVHAPQPYWVLGSCDHTLQSIQNSSCTTINTLTFNGSLGFSDSLNIFPDGSFAYTNTSLLRLEWNGNLRAYAIQDNIKPLWSNVYDLFSISMLCHLPMHCGPYGVCKGKGQCACPNQTSGNSPFVQPNDDTQSCDLAQPLQSSCPLPNNSMSTNPSRNLQMLEFDGLDYFSNVFTLPLPSLKTEQRCKDECLYNCSCLAAFWHSHSLDCFHVDWMGGLLGSYVDAVEGTIGHLNNSYRAFLKVDNATNRSNPSNHKYVIGVVSGLLALLLLSSLFYFMYRRVNAKFKMMEEEPILDAIPGLPTRFSYRELHLATNGFADKLGQGGFGVVYAGTLLSNGITTKVAVKQLEGVRQGDKEFRSEVAIMGGIHHFNLLHLLGFCAQGSHRLLVYEYMENGSLDQWLFTRRRDTVKTPLPWDVRCRIAVGVARGLSYLHADCRERIIHMDIKPQNILLDDNFVAKVADFGLSRLMERDKSHVMTTMRGTPGYLAPEWVKEGTIDEKCDVYSFGMLLLEIISGRKNLDHTMESERQTYYPEWAFWQAQKESDICELTNANVESEEEKAEVRRMLNIAFLCLLENPTLRPSMEKVVQMLEGHVPVSHIHLSTLHQGLLFVLRNPSTFAQTQIEGAIANILASPSTSQPATNTTCSGEMSSLYISAR